MAEETAVIIGGTMDDNTIAVIFCSEVTAKRLVGIDGNCKDSLVVSNYIGDDEAIMVSKDEFLDWLYERKQKTA